MSSTEKIFNPYRNFAFIAAFIALIGLGDALYLTIHHYTAAPVPCSEIFGCEKVLTSPYATMAGIPIALFGAAAYLSAFVLALLTAFGRSNIFWMLFTVQVIFMAAFSSWLLYLQGFVIEAFCQFCLISAGVTFTLLTLALLSLFLSRRKPL